MAQYNKAISVTFNDNDGSMNWSCNPESAYDVARHIRVFGKLRTRWIMFKRFYSAMIWLENYSMQRAAFKPRLWVLKAEIPE